MKEWLSDRRVKFSLKYALAAFLILTLLQQLIIGPLLMNGTEIPYSEFTRALEAGEVRSVSVAEDRIDGEYSDGSVFYAVRVEDRSYMTGLTPRASKSTGGSRATAASWRRCSAGCCPWR